MLHIVEIGGMAFSDKPSDVIITHALASCVAVTAYCRTKKAAGMIHIALPKTSGNSSVHREGYFAEIGLPLFLERFTSDYNCVWGEFDLRIYGGANSINGNDVFDIGSKNLLSIKKILNNYSLNYRIVATGGYVSRTIELSVSSGEIKLSELPIRI